jgi:hypothetical protein
MAKERADMKPTISNAFIDAPDSAAAASGTPLAAAESQSGAAGRKAGAARNPRKSLAASLSSMQADLRETEFGWSLELSPITAVDALGALNLGADTQPAYACLVSMEQSAWREGDNTMPLAHIAQRLAIPVTEAIDDEQLVLDALPLRQLVSLCQPTRLLITLVEGMIDTRDAAAMNAAVDAERSPLTAELRAVMALEVMGDRSIVLHCRDKNVALRVVAENFRHYLAALRNRPAQAFQAPETWQLERLFEATGSLTVRPIETQSFSTSIDVGINTAKDRFGQPANRSLIYDIPSNTWHDEP